MIPRYPRNYTLRALRTKLLPKVDYKWLWEQRIRTAQLYLLSRPDTQLAINSSPLWGFNIDKEVVFYYGDFKLLPKYYLTDEDTKRCSILIQQEADMEVFLLCMERLLLQCNTPNQLVTMFPPIKEFLLPHQRCDPLLIGNSTQHIEWSMTAQEREAMNRLPGVSK